MIVCNKWYPKLVESLSTAYGMTHENTDIDISRLISYLKSTNTIHRCLYIPLCYIQEQANNTESHADLVRVQTCVAFLDDLSTLLCGLASLCDIPVLFNSASIARYFYEEYYEHGVFLGMNIPLEPVNAALISLGHYNNVPPQYMTIKWYKDNGWGLFIKNKVIIPNTGPYLNMPLRIKRFKGSITKCIVVDTGVPCSLRSKQHTVTWN